MTLFGRLRDSLSRTKQQIVERFERARAAAGCHLDVFDAAGVIDQMMDGDVVDPRIDRLIRQVTVDDAVASPKAVIAPHAGYIYSGPIAASAHAR